MPSIIEKVKSVYLLWHEVHIILPQVHRYTLGNRIDKLFLEIIESISYAYFLPQEEKLPYIQHSIKKADVLKILLMILWETNSIDEKKYVALSMPLDEVGKMLGGWNNKLKSENSPASAK